MLSPSQHNALKLNLNKIEAQETLLAIQVATYKDLKKEEREKIHRQLMNEAYPDKMEKRQLTFQDLQAQLAMR